MDEVGGRQVQVRSYGERAPLLPLSGALAEYEPLPTAPRLEGLIEEVDQDPTDASSGDSAGALPIHPVNDNHSRHE